MSKILVTGHRGWIGSNFTKLLDQQGIDWIGVDRQEGEDILDDFSIFENKIDQCDIVVHLAATARIPRSWQEPDHYRDNNLKVTEWVARTCSAKNKYLIFASTSCVYGNGNGPLNPYAWTKLAGEDAIRMYGRSKELNYTIARIFTNYGDDDDSGLVIGKWLSAYKLGNPLIVRGSGNQSRDFINVSDTAKALLAIVEAIPYQQTLDIGTGVSSRLLDLANIFGKNTVFEPELSGYADATKADLTYTKQHITWSPQVEITSWLRSKLNK
jgi:nucleoside-diphosphate-sugar epimerase